MIYLSYKTDLNAGNKSVKKKVPTVTLSCDTCRKSLTIIIKDIINEVS